MTRRTPYTHANVSDNRVQIRNRRVVGGDGTTIRYVTAFELGMFWQCRYGRQELSEHEVVRGLMELTGSVWGTARIKGTGAGASATDLKVEREIFEVLIFFSGTRRCEARIEARVGGGGIAHWHPSSPVITRRTVASTRADRGLSRRAGCVQSGRDRVYAWIVGLGRGVMGGGGDGCSCAWARAWAMGCGVDVDAATAVELMLGYERGQTSISPACVVSRWGWGSLAGGGVRSGASVRMTWARLCAFGLLLKVVRVRIGATPLGFLLKGRQRRGNAMDPVYGSAVDALCASGGGYPLLCGRQSALAAADCGTASLEAGNGFMELASLLHACLPRIAPVYRVPGVAVPALADSDADVSGLVDTSHAYG
ncbi:hypothetical protein DFH08DRAFT_818856 [Mycena albidolilacea]|uniref:Uncharacterized protein n=1 Tax=Mycena albidolilacea TaxID=1033008 RepID=A0AAD7EGZ1_9AGAR|nr:hypothetical protein DFH08DRAFT_818856 [Mycena albidolilacea]